MKSIMKNKFIAAVLMLCFLINAVFIAPVFADDNTQGYVLNANYDKAWSITRGLKINTFKDTQRTENISRAEFAGVLYNAFLNDGGKGTTQMFTKDGGSDAFSSAVSAFADVSQEDLYFNEINKIAGAGFMSGDENGNFNPDENVTYIQVLKTLLTIAGYNSIAVTESDWTVAYYKLARKLDMCIENTDTNSELAKEEVMQIFYNLLNVKTLTVKDITNNNIHYSSKSNKTVLKEILDVNLYEGQMTYNGYSYITYNENADGGKITVDGVSIKTNGDIPVLNLLGRNVKAYCTKNDELLYVIADDDDDVTKINARDIESFNGSTVEYSENNKTKKISISGYPVILNGKALGNYNNDLFDFEFGNVVISNDLKYVNITRYDNVIVSSIDSYTNTIYDEVSGLSITVNDSDAVFIYNSNNEKITFADITPDNVILSISTDGYKELYVSDNVVSGTLESIDREGRKIKVSSKNYNLADSINIDDFKISSNVKIYVNTMGYVSYIKYDLKGNDFIYGYVVKSDKVSSLNTIYKSKIYSEDGKFYTLEYAQKIKATDSKNNTSTVDITKIGNIIGGYTGLLRYKLNVDGLINCIEIPLKSKDDFVEGQDRLVEKYIDSTGANCYRTETKSFGYDAYLDGSVKIFTIPDDLSNEDAFDIVDMGELVDIETNTLYAYFNEFDTAIPEAVVLNNRASKNVPTPTDLKVVTKIYSEVVDDEIYDCATLAGSGSKTVTVRVKREDDVPYFDNVKSFIGLNNHKLCEGDIVTCTYNADSFEVLGIAVVFASNDEAPAGKGANKGYLADCGYIASEQRYSDKYFINTDLYNEYMSGTTKFDSISSFIAPQTANALTGQNPMRVSTQGIVRPNAHASYADGYMYMMGYVADKGNMFVKLTTQDLSASDYIESGIPDVEDTFVNGTTSYTGIYFQRYHKLAQTWANHILVEYTNKGVTVKNANFDDVHTYKEAGNNCSRMLVYKAAQFVIINDYRTKGR